MSQHVNGLLQNTVSVAKGENFAYFLAAVRNSLRRILTTDAGLVVFLASAFRPSKSSPARFVLSPAVLVDPVLWVYRVWLSQQSDTVTPERMCG